MLSETVISVTYVTRVSGVRHKSHISQNVTREAEGPNERTRVVSLPPRTAHACRERETPIERRECGEHAREPRETHRHLTKG